MHLEGTVTVSPEIDDTEDYSGFEVLVAQQTPEGVDTLAWSITGRDGTFSTDVQAPARDLYPLVVQRRGETLASTSIVVAEGDSATFSTQLPVERPIRINSFENSAWAAYENTIGVHRQRIVERLQGDEEFQVDQMESNVRQTAEILWNLQDTYANTLGAAHSMAEAAILLEGWDDDAAIERARTLDVSNPRLDEVVQSVRHAVMRQEGVEPAIEFVREFMERAPDEEQRAAMQAEIARIHIEEGQQDEALAAARELRDQFPDSAWAEWADRAEYEVRNLMPGMEAPTFAAETVDEQPLDLEEMRGRPMMLEFYVPSNDLFQRQLQERNALYEGTRDSDLEFLSVSLQPDTLQNEAFFDGREIPGTHVFATEELANTLIEQYNIGALPTRVLIDSEGNIVSKYESGAIGALQDDIASLIGADFPMEGESE